MGIVLLIISITLFAPLISGETVFAEVKIYSFNTPADIPIQGLVPGALAQFFGAQISRVEPKLNLY
jgi:hypothetical protein